MNNGYRDPTGGGQGGDLLRLFLPPLPPTGQGGRHYGVYPAVVVDNQDPAGLGRVRIRLPWLTDPDGAGYEAWARIATLMAGANRGSWFIPEPDDEVLVAFEAGDGRRPYVLGALWNGVDSPPETMQAGNPIRSLTSRSGIKITLDDSDGAVQLTLETPGGQRIVCTDSPAALELTDANGNRITLDAAGITLETPAKLSISAGTVEVSAGMVTVNAGMSKFSGVVQSDTNITNSTISASYTPGAGNLW
ncbi:MAG TPA: phage baseplate assembly protein V [Caldilineaceae bacterium]|nr:phage baseplate assembly protein V [Caldilineaceae bacterium]